MPLDLPPVQKLCLPPKPAIVRASSREELRLASFLPGMFPAGAAATSSKVELPTLLTTLVSSLQNPTFTGVNLGAVSPDRIIIVGAANAGGSAHTIDSCTINGVTATEHQGASFDGFRHLALFSAKVPTGTTGVSISVTQSGAPSTNGLVLIVLRSVAKSPIASSGINNPLTSGTNISLAQTVPAGGFGVWFASHRNTGINSNTTTWTGSGVTELSDPGIASQSDFSGAYSASAGSVTAQAAWLGSDTRCIVGGVWNPF